MTLESNSVNQPPVEEVEGSDMDEEVEQPKGRKKNITCVDRFSGTKA